MITTMERSRLVAWLLVLLVAAPAPVIVPQPVVAQQPAAAPPPAAALQGAGGAAFTSEQLEQLTAPIALYPDPLLAQILMASTYPLEVAQAARFMKDNTKLQGAQLDEKLKDQTWDDSVKSLCSFPQVLELMDQKLDWVQKLGDAVLAQQKDVLDAVQRLRARAQKEGTLKSTPEQKVTVEVVATTPEAPPPPAPGQPAPPQTVVVQQPPAQVITIEPTNPQVVYVPSYNPTVVYGAWPYPAYPPVYPYPPGYAFGAAALSFGVGMAVGAAVWGNCNWGGGEVNINNSNYQNYSKNVNRSTERADRVQQRQGSQTERQGNRGDRQANRSGWQHNPENRRGVQYRDQGTQQRYNRGSNQQAVQSREQFRGRAEQGRQELSRGGAGQFGGQGGRPQQLGGAGGGAGRGQLGGAQGAARSQQRGGGQGGFGGGREAGAFQGMGSGRDAGNFSNRGQSSRQSIGAGGGGRGASMSRPTPSGGGARGGGGGGGSRGGGGGGRGGGRR